ncbi:hypothetical protein [Rhizobium leguminosarum]|nr:hypothetical protein U8Q02_41245 [Rhizobium leguminosarum]
MEGCFEARQDASCRVDDRAFLVNAVEALAPDLAALDVTPGCDSVLRVR